MALARGGRDVVRDMGGREMDAVTREQALEAALRKFEMHYPQGINTWLDDAWREARAALAMSPAQVEFTRGWEAGRDAAADVCAKKAEQMARASSDTLAGAYTIAEDAIRALPPAPEASHDR